MIEYMFLEEDGETQYWLGGTILRGMGSKKSAKDWWTVAFEDDSNLGVSLRVAWLCLLCSCR